MTHAPTRDAPTPRLEASYAALLLRDVRAREARTGILFSEEKAMLDAHDRAEAAEAELRRVCAELGTDPATWREAAMQVRGRLCELDALAARDAAWRDAMTDLFGDAGPPGREDEGWWLHEDVEESVITPAESVRQLTQLWRRASELAERLTTSRPLGDAVARVAELVALDPPADTPEGRELVRLSSAVATAEAAEARVQALEAEIAALKAPRERRGYPWD